MLRRGGHVSGGMDKGVKRMNMARTMKKAPRPRQEYGAHCARSVGGDNWAVPYLRRDAATPLGSGAIGGSSGGVARASLNPRLIAGIPPGWWKAGGVCRWGSVNARGGRWGWRGFAGLSEPGYIGCRARGAGRRRGELTCPFICSSLMVVCLEEGPRKAFRLSCFRRKEGARSTITSREQAVPLATQDVVIKP